MTGALLPEWRAVRRLLAVRLDNLGDVLMTTPALAAVRQGLPGAHVTLLASPAGAALRPHLPDVDEVMAFEAPWVQSACAASQAGPAMQAFVARLAEGRFDAAVVFTVCTQSALPMATLLTMAGIPLRLAHARENPYHLLSHWVRDQDVPADGMRHEVQRQLDLVAAVGIGPPSTAPPGRPATALRFAPLPQDGARLAARLRQAGVDPAAPYFVVHPGASAASRRYPAERFALAAQAVARAGGGHAVVVGGQAEAALVEAARPAGTASTALVGDLSLGELAMLMGGARVTLCNNSGPAHIAAAMGAPAVVLYALTNPQHTPWQAPARVLSHDVPCRNCLRSVCPMAHHACLLGVPPADVAAAAVELMEPGGPQRQVAVVMATFRRPGLLRRCLTALMQQSLEGRHYEVLVVDDGPDEETRRVVEEIAASAGGSPAVRYLRNVEGKGPASARNVGWRASAAPLIAFTDDDTVPDADWLRQGCEAMAGSAAAASGRVRVPVAGRPTDHARMTQGLETAEFVTANAFVKREVLERVGGFDGRFKRAWREDSDLQFAIQSAGGEIVRAEQAVVLHPVRPAPWGVSLGQQANVVFDGLLYKKHRALFLQKIRRRPPWLYVAIVGLTIAGAAALAAGAPRAAGACALGAVAGIGRFAAMRLRGASLAPSHVAEMLCTSALIPFLALWWRAVGVLRFKVIYP